MSRPQLSAVLELLKPITWFPPMWAFACGVVASGVPLSTHWPLALVGVLLAGPLVCATSQAVNDWFDRHVDAINEPQRPIPSGRLPGRWGLGVAIAWTALSLLTATVLIMAVGIFIPMGPLAGHFKLQALPLAYFPWLVGILAGYVLLTTVMKRWYVRRYGWQ